VALLLQLMPPEGLLFVLNELILEHQIALCSDALSILTPTALALLALLTPFHWQGVLVPIMPASAGHELLEAPVPFIVGLSSSYLRRTRGQYRPPGESTALRVNGSKSSI
jgi:hypothetical protein